MSHGSPPTGFHRSFLRRLSAILTLGMAIHASDLVDVLPLTDRILMLHFDDGYVVHHQRGQPRTQEQVIVNPLDVTAASRATSYSVRSLDDANYRAVRSPVAIGRKSKGTDFAWGSKHTRPGDEKKDPPLRHARAYAAAALFRLTGDAAYERQFATDTADIGAATQLWDDRQYGPMVYALGGGKAEPDRALQERMRDAILATADAVVASAEKRALRWGGNWFMPMLVGQQTTPLVFPAAVGCTLVRQTDPAKAQRYRAALYTTCDYVLGGNALNMTWITGIGPRHPQHVFHLDAWYNGRGSFHPGIIPYGPWRKEKNEGQGPWDVAWPHPTAYPPIDEWPGNERWFDNRCSPMNSEFTVHQNIGPAAALFGFLCAPGTAVAPLR